MSIGILTLGRVCTGTGSGVSERDKIEVSSPVYMSMNLTSVIRYGDSGSNYMFIKSPISPWGLYGQVLYLYSKIDLGDVL